VGGTEKHKPNTTYFLENLEYYEKRANPYGYAYDTIRWNLLCKGVLEFLLISDWTPDIIVCTDWAIGYLPNYLKTEYKHHDKLKNIATAFSIHNLSYQGMFRQQFVSKEDYDTGLSALPSFEDSRMRLMNGMRRGIIYADVINTVSANYAHEIVTNKVTGEGLNTLLSKRKSVLHGILNGLDYELMNPETDPSLAAKFSRSSLAKRLKNKRAVQKYFGLPLNPDAFLIGIVSRLNEQKGFDLLVDSVDKILEELDVQLVVLGEGDTKYMDYFKDLQEKFPKHVGFKFNFERILPRLIFAGTDSVLIPSKFEPSGLIQMEAMRYGSVPIVRKVGGLADTVHDHGDKTAPHTGFVFEKFDPFSLSIAIVRAYENFRNPALWKKIQQNGMSQDFSWASSALKYEAMFKEAIKRGKHAKK
jgi:starch synthase